MFRLVRRQHFAFWAVAFVLLLKAAVPMLASASAQAQGRTLVEVCTVYGVATVALDDAGTQGTPEHGQAHSGEHCTLTAVLALALPHALPAAVWQLSPPAQAPPRAWPVPVPDAGAAWFARLKHGPPVLS